MKSFNIQVYHGLLNLEAFSSLRVMSAFWDHDERRARVRLDGNASVFRENADNGRKVRLVQHARAYLVSVSSPVNQTPQRDDVDTRVATVGLEALLYRLQQYLSSSSRRTLPPVSPMSPRTSSNHARNVGQLQTPCFLRKQ